MIQIKLHKIKKLIGICFLHFMKMIRITKVNNYLMNDILRYFVISVHYCDVYNY